MQNGKPALILNGRSYPLFRIGKKPDSPWRVRVQARGRRASLSLSTPDPDQAIERARAVVASALAGDWQTIDALRPESHQRPDRKSASVGQVLQASASLPGKSVPLYRKSLMRVLITATGQTVAAIKRLPLDALTAPLARSFQAKTQGQPRADPQQPAPGNGTANNHLSNCRSLFSRKAIAHYERLGLHIPDLRPFCSVPLLIVEKDRYSDDPIPSTTLREIDAALSKQPGTLRKTHEAIRLRGMPPGAIPKTQATAHARFLKRWELTPSDLWRHAAACMLRRTSSLEVAAAWAGMGIQTAKWHIGALQKDPAPLTKEETYLE